MPPISGSSGFRRHGLATWVIKVQLVSAQADLREIQVGLSDGIELSSAMQKFANTAVEQLREGEEGQAEKTKKDLVALASAIMRNFEKCQTCAQSAQLSHEIIGSSLTSACKHLNNVAALSTNFSLTLLKALDVSDGKVAALEVQKSELEHSSTQLHAEVAKLRATHDRMNVQLEEIKANLEEASDLAKNYASPAEVFLGGGTGAGLGYVAATAFGTGLLGTTGIFLAAPAVAVYGSRWVMSKVADERRYEAVLTSSEADPVQASFDTKSSGFFGRLRGKTQSTTVGALSIKLPGQTAPMTCRFDLSRKGKDKISSADMLKLVTSMQQCLATGDKQNATKCLAIIDKLQNFVLERGPSYGGKQIGLVSTISPALSLLESKCNIILNPPRS